MLVEANVSRNELYVKLAQEYAKLDKVDSENATPKIKEAFSVELSQEETTANGYNKDDYERVLERLKQRDSEVKSHEQAHAGSGIAASAISYNYQTGPDGKLYAVGGSVRLNVSIPNDPNAALNKLNQIQGAATAPSGELSSADLGIAQAANLNKMLILSKLEEQNNQNEQNLLNPQDTNGSQNTQADALNTNQAINNKDFNSQDEDKEKQDGEFNSKFDNNSLNKENDEEEDSQLAI